MAGLHRRHVLLGSVAILATGCGKPQAGTEEIKYGREACTYCGMIISDPRFANEVRGGTGKNLMKFDDIGCAVNWLEDNKWQAETITEFWVMDSTTGKDWLEARKVLYLPGAETPMGYGFAAVTAADAKAVNFAAMKDNARQQGLARAAKKG